MQLRAEKLALSKLKSNYGIQEERLFIMKRMQNLRNTLTPVWKQKDKFSNCKPRRRESLNQTLN